MPPDVSRWLLALAAAIIIAGAARARRALNPGGMIAAVVLGTTIVGTAGWWAGLILVTFFVSSSILSRVGSPRSSIAQVRGSERDAVQVIANGGVALAAGVLFAVTGHAAWILVLAGAIAAANADTWSTEIGRTSATPPRLVTSWRLVPAGTSGAVSTRGLLGAAAGAALPGTVAAIGWRLGWLPGDLPILPALAGVTVGGFAGALLDSLLGATVQDKRWCDSCEKLTEERTHRCGTPTRSVSGVAWIDNDVVNMLCTLAGGMSAWIVAALMT